MTLLADISALVLRRTGLLIEATTDVRRVVAWVEGQARDARVSPQEMIARIARHSELWEALLAEVTNGQTSFFRDPEVFDVLAALMAERSSAKPFSVWSAACSTGQEPYSVAMTAIAHDTPAEILATDVNPAAVKAARTGIYDVWGLRGVPPDALVQHFVDEGHGRKRVVLQGHVRLDWDCYNLMAFSPPRPSLQSTWDVILCRNVLIYFTKEDVTRIVRSLATVLSAGGILILGGSEALHGLDVPFEPARVHGRVLYRLRQGRNNADAWWTRSSLDPEPEGSLSPRPVCDVVGARGSAAEEAPTPLGDPQAQARVWATRAHALVQAHAFDDARAAYAQALALDSLFVEARLGEAVLHRKRGHHEAACRSLEQVLFLEPSAWSASFLLVGTYERLGRPTDAERERARTRRLLGAGAVPWVATDPGLVSLLPNEDEARAVLGE